MDYEDFGGLSPDRIAREEEARRQYLLNHKGALAQQQSRRGALMNMAADPKYQAAEQAMLQQRQLGELMRTNPKLGIQLMTLQQKQQAAMTPKPVEPFKPPSGYRTTPTGDLMAIPGGPADLKAQAEAKKIATGADDVGVALASLRDAYDRLEKGGGITSTKNAGVGNLMPALSSSGVGQVAGRWLGTNNQSARNDIAMSRPSLLAALMKATGMTSRQLDSNAELKLWLTTATDPTLDVESNRRALSNIERKYISGADAKPYSGQERRAPDAPPPGAVRRKQ